MLKPDFINALIGGALIGIAAAGMMWANGRVMGISGILGGIVSPANKDVLWRVLFLAGVVLGSLLIPTLGFTTMQEPFDRGIIAAAVGGLLVGIGTTIGNGCTSGHGVCGLSRFSPRSLVATLVFMTFGILSVAAFNYFLGAGQ